MESAYSLHPYRNNKIIQIIDILTLSYAWVIIIRQFLQDFVVAEMNVILGGAIFQKVFFHGFGPRCVM